MMLSFVDGQRDVMPDYKNNAIDIVKQWQILHQNNGKYHESHNNIYLMMLIEAV